MSKFFQLTKVLLKCGLGSTDTGNGKRRGIKSGIGKAALYIVIAASVLILMASFFLLGSELFEQFSVVGAESLLVEMILLAGMFVVFIFGLPMIISVFYMTSDLENLLVLPIRPMQLVGAKFLVSLLYEYLIALAVVAPFLAGVGVVAGYGVSYWIMFVITILILPVIPLIYAGLICMVVMRVFKKAHNREMLTIVITIFTMILSIGINMLVQNSAQTEMVTSLILQKDFIGIFSKLFPSIAFIERGMIQANWLDFGIALVITGAFVLLFLFISEKVYIKGVVGMKETGSRSRKLTEQESQKFSRKSSAVRSYTKKEVRLLLRTPVYMLNCILMTVIWPLFVLIPVIYSFSQGLGETGVDLNQFMNNEVMDWVNKFINSPTAIGVILVVVYAIGAFIGSSNLTCATAISREGKGFAYMKAIPLSYMDQLKAKRASGVWISIGGTLSYIILAELAAVIFLDLSPLVIVFSAVINILFQYILGNIQLLCDLRKPKLTWENEAAAVKQNMNGVIAMLLCIVISGLIGYGAFMIYGFLDNVYITATIVSVILFVLVILLNQTVYAYGSKKLADIE